jgi:hypothetical protein
MRTGERRITCRSGRFTCWIIHCCANHYGLNIHIPEDELAALMHGYGYDPHFVGGDDPAAASCRVLICSTGSRAQPQAMSGASVGQARPGRMRPALQAEVLPAAEQLHSDVGVGGQGVGHGVVGEPIHREPADLRALVRLSVAGLSAPSAGVKEEPDASVARG